MSRARFRLLAAKGYSPPVAPQFVSAPVIGGAIGSPAVGVTLSVSTGVVSGSPATFTYQWMNGASPIALATTANYTIQAGDPGDNIYCVVTATNVAGSASANSNTVVPVESVPGPVEGTLISPPAQWTQTYGSGFDALGNRPVVSTRTNRVTARPILQRRQEDMIVFTEPGGYLGVTSAMSAEMGGMSHVICSIEGAEYQSDAMTPRTRTDARTGLGVIEWAYWFEVDTANFAGEGSFEVYFIGVAADPDLQNTVIGPFRYHHFATEFTHTFNVYPGAPNSGFDWTTPKGAWDAIKTNATYYNGRPLVEMATGTYPQFTVSSFPVSNGYKRVMRAAAGATVVIAGSVVNELTTWSPGINGLWFENISIDRRYLGEMRAPSVANCKMGFKGGGWINTHPDGAYGLFNANLYPGIVSEATGTFNADPNLAYPFLDTYEMYFIDTEFVGIGNGPRNAFVYNCYYSGLSGDLFSEARGAYNVIIEGVDPQPLREGIDAISVGYSGGEATASFAYLGGTATVRIGATAYTKAIYTGSQPTYAQVTAGSYFVADVVNWINGLGVSGLSATLLDNTRRAAFLQEKDPIDNVPSFTENVPQTSIKGVTVTFCTAIDAHGDVGQYSDGRMNWNVGWFNVRLKDSGALQIVFLTNSTFVQQDMAFVNIMADTRSENYNSQLTTSAKAHILFHYIHMPEQDFDAYNGNGWLGGEMVGSAFKTVIRPFGATVTGSRCLNNFVMGAGNQTAFMNMTQSTVTALYDDYANENYAPKAGGPLRTGMAAPVVPFDINNVARNALTAWGPIEAAA